MFSNSLPTKYRPVLLDRDNKITDGIIQLPKHILAKYDAVVFVVCIACVIFE